MIANITYGSRIYGLIRYNEDKVAKGEGRVLFEKGFIGGNFKNRYQKLREYCQKRSDLKYNTTHISLSFHKKDSAKLNDQLYLEIAQEYLEAMGYGEQPYIAYEHFDRQHPHLHLVLPKITAEGKAITGQSDRYRSRQIARDLEKKYEITIARQKDQRKTYKQSTDTEIARYAHLSETEAKAEINKAIRHVKANYHYSSVKDYRYILNQYGVDVEHHKGETDWGEAFEGLSYYLYDSETKKRVTKSIKGAKTYSKNGTLRNISYSFDYHKKAITKKKKYPKKQLERILNQYERITLEDFITKAKEKNLHIDLIYSQKNIPIGLRLLDENNGFTANFSQLDRKWGWKNLQEHFVTNYSVSKREAYLVKRAIRTHIFKLSADFGSQSEAREYMKKNKEEAIFALFQKNKKGFSEISITPENLYSYIAEQISSSEFDRETQKEREKEIAKANHQITNLHRLNGEIKEEYLESLYRNYYFYVDENRTKSSLYYEIDRENTATFCKPELKKDIGFSYADKKVFDAILEDFNDTRLFPFFLNYSKMRKIFKENSPFLEELLKRNERKYISDILVNNKGRYSGKNLITMLYRRGLEIVAMEDQLYIKYHSSDCLHEVREFPEIKVALKNLSDYEYQLLQQEIVHLQGKGKFLKNLEAQALHFAMSGDIGNYLKTSNYLLQQLDNGTFGTAAQEEPTELLLTAMEEKVAPVLPQSWFEKVKQNWSLHFHYGSSKKQQEKEVKKEKKTTISQQRNSTVSEKKTNENVPKKAKNNKLKL